MFNLEFDRLNSKFVRALWAINAFEILIDTLSFKSLIFLYLPKVHNFGEWNL